MEDYGVLWAVYSAPWCKQRASFVESIIDLNECRRGIVVRSSRKVLRVFSTIPRFDLMDVSIFVKSIHNGFFINFGQIRVLK